MTRIKAKAILFSAMVLSLIVPVAGMNSVSATVDGIKNYAECADKVANAMHEKSAALDNTKVLKISSLDDAFTSKMQGYNSGQPTVFYTWDIDYNKCDVTLDVINVGHVLKTGDEYVRTIVASIDPEMTQITKIDEYKAPFYASDSEVWSGYAIQPSPSDDVWESKTQYTLPSVSRPTDDLTDPCRTDLGKEPCDLAIWTGLSEIASPGNDDALAQAGSDGKITCDPTCDTEYFLWFEFLPDPAFTCSGANPPSPGNTITSIVTNQGKFTDSPSTLYNVSVQSSNGFGCSTFDKSYTDMDQPNYALYINERATYNVHGANPPVKAILAEFSSDTMDGWYYVPEEKQISTTGTIRTEFNMVNDNNDNIIVGSISGGDFSQTWDNSKGTDDS